MSEGTIKFKEFEVDEEPIRFTVGSGTYEAAPMIPVAMLQELAGLLQDFSNAGKDEDGNENIGKKIDALKEVFKVILTDESYEPFVDRLGSKTKPIGINLLSDILNWLLEVYGLRPTQSSEDSSTTSQSDDDSSSLPDGAQVMGLTS